MIPAVIRCKSRANCSAFFVPSNTGMECNLYFLSKDSSCSAYMMFLKDDVASYCIVLRELNYSL